MTKKDQNCLSTRQIKALPFLAATINCAEACKQSGIGKNTYHEWLKQPAFKTELERMRNEIVSEAVNLLKTNQ